MNLFFDRITYFAIIYDNNGKKLRQQQIDPNDKTFSSKKFEYVIDLNCPTYQKIPLMIGPILIGFNKYFYYNVDNPTPLILNTQLEPSKSTLDSKKLYIFIHTKKLEEMNHLADENMIIGLLKKLIKSPIFWIVLLFMIGLFLFLAKKGFKLW